MMQKKEIKTRLKISQIYLCIHTRPICSRLHDFYAYNVMIYNVHRPTMLIEHHNFKEVYLVTGNRPSSDKPKWNVWVTPHIPKFARLTTNKFIRRNFYWNHRIMFTNQEDFLSNLPLSNLKSFYFQ